MLPAKYKNDVQKDNRTQKAAFLFLHRIQKASFIPSYTYFSQISTQIQVNFYFCETLNRTLSIARTSLLNYTNLIKKIIVFLPILSRII